MDDGISWSTSNYPLVSFISINFNQAVHTLELIDSLKNVNYPRFEIIIVDNGSEPDQSKIIANAHPKDVLVIRSKENLGYAGGCNLGVKYAAGKYFFFLNNDLVVDRDFLTPCVEMAERKKYVGAINPKILYYDNPEIIQFAGYTKFSRFTIRNKSIGFQCKDSKKYLKSREMPTFIGAAMMIPAWTFDHIGHMNEKYFLYYEEHEWAYRMKEKGYRFYMVGEAKVYHKQSISTGKNSPLKELYLMRNRFYFARLIAVDYFWFPITLFYLYFIVGKRKKYLFEKKGMHEHAAAIQRALREGVGHSFWKSVFK